MSAAIVKALSPNLDLVRTSGVKSTVRVTVNLRVHEDDLKLKKPLSYSRAEPFTSLNPFTARVFFMKEFCEATHLWPHLAVKGLSTNPSQNHDYIFLIFPVSYLTL